MVFVDLEKAFDMVLKEVISRTMRMLEVRTWDRILETHNGEFSSLD